MGLTLNVQEVVGDFTKYDVTTQSRMGKTLATVSMLMSRHQKATLRSRVIKWTGRLASSISITKGGRLTKEIGPDANRVKYANWIEYGGRGGFTGYHYVRASINRYRKEFVSRLKQDIERPI